MNTVPFAEAIKKVSLGAVTATVPADIVTAKVKKFDLEDTENPILIELNQSLTLTKNFLILTDTIFQTMTQGDTVILIKSHGGQKYIVIDKAVFL